MFALRSAAALSRASCSSLAQGRYASSLVFLEHAKGVISPGSLSAVTAAGKIGGQVDGIITGSAEDVKAISDKAKSISGLTKLLTSSSPNYSHTLAEPLAPLLASLTSYTHILAAHSAVGKDLFPRVSALVDKAMVSDVIEVKGEGEFLRGVYAGNILSHVSTSESQKILTVRATSFDRASAEGGSATIEEIAPVDGPTPTTYISTSETLSERPDLGSAARVVSGGRALKSIEGFQNYIEPLADKLGAAIGASRAAVDSGYADNSLQVGQTGKVVAPELYIAVGISGAIQHLAGMKESKLIVAINKDPDAPIFQVADVGLVADLYEAVPELIEKL